MTDSDSDSDNVNRAFRPQPGRKYFNHMAKHSPGAWHRYGLLTSGQYIKTSDPDAYRNSRWQVVGDAAPELVAISTPPTRHPGNS